jgi:hypothetical protein
LIDWVWWRTQKVHILLRARHARYATSIECTYNNLVTALHRRIPFRTCWLIVCATSNLE